MPSACIIWSSGAVSSNVRRAELAAPSIVEGPALSCAEGLRLGGITAFTSIDFPARLAIVLFCQGCPWRCRYCHNPHLLGAWGETTLSMDDAIALLDRRHGLIDGVVFSGGEPTLHRSLPDAIEAVGSMGFEVALHTSGAYPKRMKKLLSLVDWVGMDIKAPAAKYDQITFTPGSGERAWESAHLLIESGVEHEFRTTVHPSLLSSDDVLEIGRSLAALGATRYVVQQCIGDHTLDPDLGNRPLPLTSNDLVELRAMIPNVSVRQIDQLGAR